jgi:hypothetical protein
MFKARFSYKHSRCCIYFMFIPRFSSLLSPFYRWFAESENLVIFLNGFPTLFVTRNINRELSTTERLSQRTRLPQCQVNLKCRRFSLIKIILDFAEKRLNVMAEWLTLLRIREVKSKAVPLHAMEALGGRGGIAPTHSRPRH